MSSNLPIGTKIVVTILQWRLGKVRALETALRIQGVIRFLLLAVGFIIVPAILLAYFGILSIKDQEEDAQTALDDVSYNLALVFLQDVNAEIISFEQSILAVLQNGQTPLRSFHKNQRMVLRFDQNFQMLAPFVEHNETYGADVLFHPAFNHNTSRKMDMDERTWDNILYKKAQSLRKNGQYGDASILLRKLWTSPYRHVTGAKLKHLALMEQYDVTTMAFEDFQSIMEQILSEPWTIGEGIDGQLIHNFLQNFSKSHSELRPKERTYLNNTKSRIEQQMEELFWASKWEDEWREIIASPRQSEEGHLLFEMGENALWARTFWRGDWYVFGLDKEKMIQQLRLMADSDTRKDEWVSLKLLEPNQPSPVNTITRRYIPWLEGWSVVVVEQDVSFLEEQDAIRRQQKYTLVGVALLIMVFGAVLSSRVAMTELKNANIKSNFAASVSHELRSPITQIRLKGESLMFGLVDDDEELQEHYESIVRESERLSWLVDNVLDYAAIERENKSFVLREGNLLETVQRVIDSMQVTLTMRDVVIETDFDQTLPWMKFDSNAVGQCMTNLLSNAEKYSGVEKSINVLIRRNQNFVDIMVVDKGIGIREEDCQDIFEPFFRSKEQSALRRKGTGIGLSITRSIMEAHGGNVLVKSQLGKGSTFTLRFPSSLLIQGG